MTVTEQSTVGENVTPEQANARLAEIKAKERISDEEEEWVRLARTAGLLPPLTPEEQAAEDACNLGNFMHTLARRRRNLGR